MAANEQNSDNLTPAQKRAKTLAEKKAKESSPSFYVPKPVHLTRKQKTK